MARDRFKPEGKKVLFDVTAQSVTINPEGDIKFGEVVVQENERKSVNDWVALGTQLSGEPEDKYQLQRVAGSAVRLTRKTDNLILVVDESRRLLAISQEIIRTS